jgi:hypothetical protein
MPLMWAILDRINEAQATSPFWSATLAKQTEPFVLTLVEREVDALTPLPAGRVEEQL